MTSPLWALNRKSGRAVSADAGAPYADKLLELPPFMLGAQAGLSAGDVGAGLDLTGHFLEQFIFHPQNRPIPPARVWMVDKLREQGRL
jgi:DNA repair protein RecO (recombination protein O)